MSHRPVAILAPAVYVSITIEATADEAEEGVADLSADRCADHDPVAELSEHPGHPHPLPASVDVHVVPVGHGLDGDRDVDGRREDRDGSVLHGAPRVVSGSAEHATPPPDGPGQELT